MPESLTPAQKFAFDALIEVTPEDTIGDFSREVDEGEGATSYLFEATMSGYPGWNWTVTVEQLPGEEPTILETELMPAEGALLAPDWVPWSERMDDYRAAQLAAGEALEDGDDSDVAEASDEDESDDETDDDESDDDDDDDDSDDDDDDESDDDSDDDFLGSDVLHSGDLDGVDIDELDVSDELDVTDELDSAEDSDASAVGVDEGEESESDARGTGEEPPRVVRGRQRARKEQQPNEA